VNILPEALETVNVVVLPAQTVVLPLITGVGGAIRVMVLLTVESQPNALVCVTVIVPVAEVPHDISTVLVMEELLKLPPVTDHAYVFPGTLGTEYVEAVNWQTLGLPEITGTG
jgi:hypothetical protein